MKHLYVLLCSLISCCFMGIQGAKAQTADSMMVQITLNSGTIVQCDFAKRPQMTFDNGKITLTAVDTQTQTWEFNEVKSWNFAVSTVVSVIDASKERITINDRKVCINSRMGEHVVVSNVKGQIIARSKANIDGYAEVDLNRFGQGIYIISVGKNKMKLVVH